jgi:hypothetical protein
MVVLGIFDRLKENVVEKNSVYLIFIKVYLTGALTVNSTCNINT